MTPFSSEPEMAPRGSSALGSCFFISGEYHLAQLIDCIKVSEHSHVCADLQQPHRAADCMKSS